MGHDGDVRTRPPVGAGGRLFALVIGLVVGVLVTMLVAPPAPVEVVVGDQDAAEQAAAGQASPAGEGGVVADGAGPPDASEAQPLVAPPAGTATGGAGDAQAYGDPAEGVGAAQGGVGGGSGQRSQAGRSAGSANPGATARGVSEKKIRIGVAIPDLSAIRHLGPEFDSGNVEEQWQAMLDGWRRSGRLPVHGRDVEFVYRKYDVWDASSERAACVGFIRDQQVFAVVGVSYFDRGGSECVAQEFKTPVLTGYGATDDVFERSHPYMFSVGMSNSRVVRNMVHWAHHRGLLKGRTIGIYHLDDATETALVEEDIKPQLTALGYEVRLTHQTGQPLGGPQDAVAVQRFRSARVDLAILLTSKAGFMQQAEAQNYRPTYVESDHESGTSDTAAERYPPEQFDGTFGMTGRTAGQLNAGRPMTRLQRACLQNYERYARRDVDEGSTEYTYILLGCDDGDVLLTAIEAAGPKLTAASFIAGMESIRSMPLRRLGPASFSPAKHHGTDVQRTVQWRAKCTCWHVVSDWGRLWVK